MSNDNSKVLDEVVSAMDRPRSAEDHADLSGLLVVELHGEDGTLKARCEVHNLVTAVGDQMYAARGAGVAGAPAAPTGMRLGSGSTAVAKSGAGSALTTYLSGGNKAFDATYPQVSAGVATYRTTYAAGEATTASPITEVAIVNDTIATDATSPEANTVARALLTGITSKAAGDSLTITWTHTVLGA